MDANAGRRGAAKEPPEFESSYLIRADEPQGRPYFFSNSRRYFSNSSSVGTPPRVPGPVGWVGLVGPVGAVGPDGPVGPVGAVGLVGEVGAVGPVGPCGPVEVGVVGVVVGPVGLDGGDGLVVPPPGLGHGGPAEPGGEEQQQGP